MVPTPLLDPLLRLVAFGAFSTRGGRFPGLVRHRDVALLSVFQCLDASEGSGEGRKGGSIKEPSECNNLLDRPPAFGHIQISFTGEGQNTSNPLYRRMAQKD